MSRTANSRNNGPTPKQESLLRDLMCAAGHAHPRFGPTAGAKAYTTVRQRQSWEGFFADLTRKQASELIDRLRK